MLYVRLLSSMVNAGWVVLLAVCAVAPVQAAPATAPSASMRWQSPELGNVFDEGKAVALMCNVDADSVDWTVYDFWHQPIESGQTAAASGQAVIRPKIAAVGYYLLHAKPMRGGAPLRDGYTSFAIVRPHTVPDVAKSPFGVMTHFAQGMNPAMLPTFRRIGVVSIRDEHYWAQVEETKGVYQFPPKSDAYMQACRAAGIEPLVAMTFGNKHYDHKEGPSTPAGYEGYANYGKAILRQYGEQVRWLEIWNEYNGTWCPPAARADRPKYYTEMLKTAYEQIKAMRPDVQVLGGAAVLIPIPYFEGIFKRGGLNYMDGVVIHPYRGRPEGVDKEVQELKALIRKFNNGQEKPIWVTETGRHSHDQYDWETGRKMFEKGRAEGARYLPRQYTLLLKENVAKIYWYLGTDHATFVSMGLLRHHENEASGMGEYAVAPAYVSYANLIHQLDGATFVAREAEREYTRAYVYHFRRGADDVRVCWATQPSKLRVQAKQPLRLYNIMGTESVLTPVNGEIVVDLSEDTAYLVGPVDAVSEVVSGPRVIASSLDDYTKTQGQNGWYYGYVQAGDPAFRPLQQVETMWGYVWGGSGRYLSVSQDNLHPDKIDGKDASAAVRWKSSIEGKVTVKAHVQRGDKGDGVSATLLVDGKAVATQQVDDPKQLRVTIEATVDVKPGSFIDLAVGPRDSTSYDATNYQVTITADPQTP